jgi:hypothetical protein
MRAVLRKTEAHPAARRAGVEGVRTGRRSMSFDRCAGAALRRQRSCVRITPGAPAKSIGYLPRPSGRNLDSPQNVRGILFQQRSVCLGFSVHLFPNPDQLELDRLDRMFSISSALRLGNGFGSRRVARGWAVAMGASYPTKLILAFRSGGSVHFLGVGNTSLTKPKLAMIPILGRPRISAARDSAPHVTMPP